MCTAVWDMELPVGLLLHLTCIHCGSSSLNSACVIVHCTICRCAAYPATSPSVGVFGTVNIHYIIRHLSFTPRWSSFV
ncbi:hypothetical protein EDC04DRAFT_2815840 [Pisolithus marmoratus]|nr:hypothetical protein EDC04DRAFT_2815840 [Pisolithus marmoratus]